MVLTAFVSIYLFVYSLSREVVKYHLTSSQKVLYNSILWKGDHIHITSIVGYCSNCFIVVINFLLCLVSKSKFYDRYVCAGDKIYNMEGIQCSLQFQASSGAPWDVSSHIMLFKCSQLIHWDIDSWIKPIRHLKVFLIDLQIGNSLEIHPWRDQGQKLRAVHNYN